MVSGIIVVLFAGFVQGLTSFGFALAALPFLARIFLLKEAVPIVVFLCLCTNLQILVSSFKEVRVKKIWLLIVSGLLCVPAGVYSLKYLNPDYLKIFSGAVIVIFSVLLISKKSFPMKKEKTGLAVTGLLSGFLNGSISLSGPPVVLFLSNQGTSKEEFRANITLYSAILNLVTSGTYFANGLFDKTLFLNAVYLVPAMAAGVFLGIKCSKKLDEKVFRAAVLILLICSGLVTILSTIIK